MLMEVVDCENSVTIDGPIGVTAEGIFGESSPRVKNVPECPVIENFSIQFKKKTLLPGVTAGLGVGRLCESSEDRKPNLRK